MKNEIVFLISDASYSPTLNIAGIGIVNLYNSKTQQKSIDNISSSLEAEKLALDYSIEYARKEGYNHVVFVYDALSIDLEPFKEKVKEDFITAQFLWLSRESTKRADKVARSARVSKEKKLPKKYDKRKYLLELTDEQLLSKFSSYEDEAILKVFAKVANKKEQSILKYYLENYGRHKCYVFEIDKNELSFYKNIYYFLSKKHRHIFAQYILDQCIDVVKNGDFKSIRQEYLYVEALECLLEKLDQKSKKNS